MTNTHVKGPQSVGIIMDGNRRWAKASGKSSFEGHRVGVEAIFTFLDAYQSLYEKWGTAHYIFYTFSTENWKRSEDEVAHLMQLFRFVFRDSREKLMRVKEYGVSIRFAGDLSRFSKDIQDMLHAIEKDTEGGTKGSVTFALSYGGRADILHAVNNLLKEGKNVLTEEDIGTHLWTAGVPDPDLIIRTGGEQRLSNFLTWQSVYSELIFTPICWPDFSPEVFEQILAEYTSRERRFGT